MSTTNENTEKVHYICQTYIEKAGGQGGQAALALGKQFQYTSATEAQERAERENRSDECIGADAYKVTEDLASGEVSQPTFLVRLGTGPEVDDF